MYEVYVKYRGTPEIILNLKQDSLFTFNSWFPKRWSLWMKNFSFNIHFIWCLMLRQQSNRSEIAGNVCIAFWDIYFNVWHTSIWFVDVFMRTFNQLCFLGSVFSKVIFSCISTCRNDVYSHQLNCWDLQRTLALYRTVLVSQICEWENRNVI